MDELNGMTYLDYVIREVLRLHSPVSNTERVATCDVVVPLNEPFIDRHGVKRHEFRRVNSPVPQASPRSSPDNEYKAAQGRRCYRPNSCRP
jgi:hypothetical protein